MNMSKYMDLFLAEAREHLSAIEDDMARLEQEPEDRPALNELFRHAHSIKGMAASMGFGTIAELAHGIEDVLDGVKQRQAGFDPSMRSVLGAAFDGVDRMIGQVGAGREPDLDVAPLLESLHGLVRPRGERAGGSPSVSSPSSLPSSAASAGEPPARPQAPAPAPAPLGPQGPASAPAPAPAPSPSRADASHATTPAPPVPARVVARPPARLRTVLLEIGISPDSPLPAARAAVAIKRLETRGRLISADPSLEDLLAGGRPERLTVVVESDVGADQLLAEIAKIQDLVPLGVTPIDSAPLEPEPPPTPEHERAADPVARAVPPVDPASAPRPAATGRVPAAAPPDAGAASPATVRIPARSLDRFLDTIGELLVQRGRLAGLLKGRSDRALDISLERLKSLVDRLYGDVMGLRMLPFETIAQRFTRSVRELASAQRKRVSFRITGREVMLDRSMLDELIDPINHVLRNAVDHGIESPADRLAAGKPESGSIAILLERAADSVTIKIEDDGRGMDPEDIRRAALRKGFLTAEACAGVDDAAALMLTTIPGFSTNDRVTEVSGRGVGMDVVRTRVERLGGRLALRSMPGTGLSVEMRLPLTIVVVQAFIVEAGGRHWAVPVSSVRRTFEILEDQIEREGARSWARIGAERVSLFDLTETLGLESRLAPPPGPRQALLASEPDRSVAFTVDRIVGRREIVVKPLRQPLEELRGYSGATILEDGRIALIVDLLSLARF